MRPAVAAVVAAIIAVAVGTTSALGTVREEHPDFARSTESRTVEGVRFSFNVPQSDWENAPMNRRVGDKFHNGSALLSKSTVGGQARKL